MRQKKNIYFKSDFTVILASEAQWGGVPFRLKFYTASPSRSFVASFDGENYENCQLLSDGRLEIAINQKDGTVQNLMGIGTLMLEPEFYLDNRAFRDHVCNEFVKPFVPVFVDDETGDEYEVTLGLEGSSTIVTIGTLPAFYQKGLTDAEHDALIAATERAERAAGNTEQAIANANDATRKADAARVTLTSTYNRLASQLSVDYDAKKSALDADYAGVKDGLSADYLSKKAQLDADYASEKAQLAKDYSAAVISLNARMTAIEQLYSTDKAEWQSQVDAILAKCVSDFNTSEEQRQQTFEDSEASRTAEFNRTQQEKQAIFEEKEATRDEANRAALDAAETLSEQGAKLAELGKQIKTFSTRSSISVDGSKVAIGQGYWYLEFYDGTSKAVLIEECTYDLNGGKILVYDSDTSKLSTVDFRGLGKSQTALIFRDNVGGMFGGALFTKYLESDVQKNKVSIEASNMLIEANTARIEGVSEEVSKMQKESYGKGEKKEYSSKVNASITRQGELTAETSGFRWARIFNVTGLDKVYVTGGISSSCAYATYNSENDFTKDTCIEYFGFDQNVTDKIVDVKDATTLIVCGKIGEESVAVYELTRVINVIKTDVVSNKRKIESLLNNEVVADYFKEELDETASSVAQKMTAPCLVLNIVTDTHISSDIENQRRTKETLQNIKALNQRVKADGVVHMGDMVMVSLASQGDNSVYEHITNYITGLYGCNDRVYLTIGNHDGQRANGFQPNRWYASGARLNDEYVVRPQSEKSYSGIEYIPAYYYKDFDTIGVRCIFLSVPENDEQYTYAMSPKQAKWFAEKALDVKDGTKVIIFAHIVPFDDDFFKKTAQYEQFRDICNAFYNHTVYQSGSINADFSGKVNSKIVAYIGGHQHFDNIANVGWTYDGKHDDGTPNTYVNEFHFPIINIGAGLMTNGFDTFGGTSPSRADKTLTQDLWDTMVYVPSENKIHLVRFGAGEDREIDV